MPSDEGAWNFDRIAQRPGRTDWNGRWQDRMLPELNPNYDPPQPWRCVTHAVHACDGVVIGAVGAYPVCHEGALAEQLERRDAHIDLAIHGGPEGAARTGSGSDCTGGGHVTATLVPSEIVMRDRAWVTVHAVARAQDAARETGNRDLVRMLARAADVALEVAADLRTGVCADHASAGAGRRVGPAVTDERARTILGNAAAMAQPPSVPRRGSRIVHAAQRAALELLARGG